MNDQGWHINVGQIITKISQPGRYTIPLCGRTYGNIPAGEMASFTISSNTSALKIL